MSHGHQRGNVDNDETTRNNQSDNADNYVLQRAGKSEPLSWDIQKDLLIRYKHHGDQRALAKLVSSYQRMVADIAFRRQHLDKGLDRADLIQEGNIGLLKAINKFDFDKGTRLSTVANWWIRSEIQNAIRHRGSILKESSHKKTIQKEWNRIRTEESRTPTTADVAKACNISEKKAAHNRLMMEDIISLNEAMPDAENMTRLDGLIDTARVSIDSVVEAQADLNYFKDLLENLSPGDAEFIRLKYGADDGIFRTKTLMLEIYPDITETELARWEKDILDYLKSIKDDTRLNHERVVKERKSTVPKNVDNPPTKKRKSLPAKSNARAKVRVNPFEDPDFAFSVSPLDI